MSTAEATEKYIETHKAVKDCMKQGLINYSALARKISKELALEKKASKDAALIASIRYAKKLKGQKTKEDEIKDLLSKGTLEIKNRVSVFVLEKGINLDSLIEIETLARKSEDVFFSVEGTKSVTLMISDRHAELVRKMFRGKILRQSSENAVVIIKSPEAIEKMTGVLGYVASLFADNDVNIVEGMSCWTDTILIVKEDEVAKVLHFMKF